MNTFRFRCYARSLRRVVLDCMHVGYEEREAWIFEDYIRESLKSLGILQGGICMLFHVVVESAVCFRITSAISAVYCRP